MRINSFFSKLIIIFFVLMLTYYYAQYQRNMYYSGAGDHAGEMALKRLPDFISTDVSTGGKVKSSEFLKGASGVFVHIWGTWCGPCEKEMPEFLAYAKSVQGKGVKFYLIAVNDEEVKIKKFIGRFVVPTNVQILIDKENAVMDLFGTLKVPETFLFDSAGKHINKFIGPQDWGQSSYKDRLDFWLNIQNLVERKIETH